MRSSFKILFLLNLLLIAACATRKEIVRFKNDVAYIRAQIDALRTEQRKLQSAILKLLTLTEQSAAHAGRLNAEIQTQLKQLAEQNQRLSERLRDMNNRIYNMPAKLRTVFPLAESTADTTEKGIKYQ